MGWEHCAAAAPFSFRLLLAAAGIFVAPVQALNVEVIALESLVAAPACPSGDCRMDIL